MTHWTETLFKDQADLYAQFFEERFNAADEQAEQLLALLDDEYGHRPETTLDLACGIGRHVVAFADSGCDAEGMDFSEQFVAEGRDRLEAAGLADRATVFQHDVRDLGELSGLYDLITSFWNSLGYYDRATDEQILADARDLLADDGVLAIELSHRDFYLANFEESSVRESEDQLFVERRDYDVETGRFSTTLDLFDASDGYDHVATFEWENRLYAPAVLRELCHDAGFADVSLFGGFEGEDLTMESDTVLALARP